MYECIFSLLVLLCVFVCIQVRVPADYHDDQELVVFHEVIAKETCMRKCKDNLVRLAQRAFSSVTVSQAFLL